MQYKIEILVSKTNGLISCIQILYQDKHSNAAQNSCNTQQTQDCVREYRLFKVLINTFWR